MNDNPKIREAVEDLQKAARAEAKGTPPKIREFHFSSSSGSDGVGPSGSSQINVSRKGVKKRKGKKKNQSA